MAGGGGYGEQFTSLVARDGRGAGADAEAGRRWAACSSMARQIKHARGLSWARVVGRAAASALCGQLLALSARRPNAIAPTPMTTLGRAGLAGAVMLARSSARASARCSRRAGQGKEKGRGWRHGATTVHKDSTPRGLTCGGRGGRGRGYDDIGGGSGRG